MKRPIAAIIVMVLAALGWRRRGHHQMDRQQLSQPCRNTGKTGLQTAIAL